ncbi:MAG: type II toxin-antitoxin system VapC family toxin [Anaerolineae bacterium]|nr:type II toxin-antitoxin system VapC family toxin [Anaerolineae bacterium]
MNILLDTHAFIGLDSTPQTLSETATAICKDPANTLFLSIASIWEIQIKISLGKLRLPRALPEIIQWQQQNNLVQLLPVMPSHIYALDSLPDHHRDPFDRMLIAQARVEDLPILTHDQQFSKYPIAVRW